ncbi:MAG: hypothetical protein LBH56_03810, partial [Coriobacteriales bacterium]|nr:hypothetical protein [Coriobacteriales bacterium]
NTPLDDFDLDSFLKENNFLPAEDRKKESRSPSRRALPELEGLDGDNDGADVGLESVPEAKPTSQVVAPSPFDEAAKSGTRSTRKVGGGARGAAGAGAGVADGAGKLSEDEASDEAIKGGKGRKATKGNEGTDADEADKADNASKNASRKTAKVDAPKKTGTSRGGESVGSSAGGGEVSGEGGGESSKAGKAETAKKSGRAAKTDLNATMSYDALGESYPEIPLVGVEKHSFDGDGAPKEKPENSRASSDSRLDFDARYFGEVRNRTSGRRETRDAESVPSSSLSKDTTRALPSTLANKVPSVDTPATGGAAGMGAGMASAAATAVGVPNRVGSTEAPKPRRRAASSAASAATSATSGATTSGSTAAGAAGSAASSGRTAGRRGAKPVPTSAVSADVMAMDSIMSGKTASRRGQRLSSLANPEDFQETHFADSSYRIRGGGTRHNRPSLPLLIIIAVVVVVGAGLLIYSLATAYDNLLVEKPPVNNVTLTSSETRTAIDEEMPRLLDYLSGNADAAYAVLAEAGQNVTLDERVTLSNFDSSAQGKKVIHLSPTVDAAILDEGYYEGGFDAYTLDELQQSFNGAWILDILHGNSGAYLQFDYINFAATSLESEFDYLRGRQELRGENSIVDNQGEDDFGNIYIQGSVLIGETRYYWKLLGLPFGDYYSGADRRKLPDTAIFVRCRIADYDFYGAAEIPTDDGSGDEESSGGEGEGEGEGEGGEG